jgi:hypothetical protein
MVRVTKSKHLKAELAVGKNTEGKDDVLCNNAKLLSRVQLLPA